MEMTRRAASRATNPARVRTRARAGGSVSGMRAGLAGVCLAAAIALLGTGCSSGGSTAASSPSPSPSSVICPDVAALRSALAQVGHLSASANALDKLKTDVARLRADAGGEWKTQIDALNSALVKLQMTLKNIGSQPSATAAAEAVSTQLAAVTTKASDLLRKASVRCPDGSASPSS